MVWPEFALWGLLHDAAEAYLVDLPRPIKQCMPDYRIYEEALARVIAERFGLPWPMPEQVKLADTAILHIERRCLLAESRLPWGLAQGGEAGELADQLDGIDLPCWEPAYAYNEFVQRFAELSVELSAPIGGRRECAG